MGSDEGEELVKTDWNDTDSFDYPSLEVVERPVQNALIALFSVTATLSLSGNITVIIVLSLGKRSSRELRPFLINLAVSDVTMAIFSIPFTYTTFLLGRWIFEPWFCPVVMVMQHVSVLASVYTLTAISIDRYQAVVKPLSRRVRKSRNKLIIIIIWVLAFLISSVQLGVSRARPFKYDKQWHYDCTEVWSSEESSRSYTMFVFLVTFVLPLIGMAYTYSVIACTMWNRAVPGNAHESRDLAHSKANVKILRMLVTVVLLFIVCWLPLQIFSILFWFIPTFGSFETETHKQVYALSYFACVWLANANSFVNPLIYSFMSENFRADAKDVLHRVGCRQKSIPRTYTGSVRSSATRSTVYRDPIRASTYVKTMTEVDKNLPIELTHLN